jgi:RNA polymerase sigma factor (sigma-70 family)
MRRSGEPTSRRQHGAAPVVEEHPYASRLAGWRREILRYVHRLTGDLDVAEDVAQDALVRMLDADGDAIRNPRAWLYRVATNVLRDGVRREEMKRRRPIPVDPDRPLTPDRDLERREAIARVRAVLDTLPVRDRELLILRESGFRYREIAQVLDVKTESIPMMVARALARFRAAYLAEAAE